MAAFSDWRNKRAFRRAQARAEKLFRKTGTPHMVCGFLRNGEPEYFVVPKDIDEEQLRETVFALRNGRPMNQAEKLFDLAMSGELVRTAERVIEHYLQREDPISEYLSQETVTDAAA